MTTSEEKIKHYLNKYQNPDVSKRDIIKTCRVYEGLICNLQPFDFSNGMRKDLVNLTGTIPVPFRGKTYNIPICIWLMDTHPNNPPICYVRPTADMSLKVSMYLDHSGKVYLPYLHNWNSNTSNLVELVQVMIKVFSEAPPVYSKVKQDSAYPKQSYGPAQPTPYPIAGASYPLTPAQYPPYPPAPTQPGNGLYTQNYSPYSHTPYPPAYPPYTPANTQTSTQSTYPPYPPSNFSAPYPAASYPLTTTTPTASTTTTTPANTGTITDEHIRVSLISAIEDKVRRKIKEQATFCNDEIEVLLQTQRELTEGKNKLDTQLENLKKERSDVEKNIQTLTKRQAELEKLQGNLSNEDAIDIDDAILTTAPVYKQIVQIYCEDAATEDTIYYIGEGLRKGVIDLDVFIKQLRALSRKQMMKRALIEKCRDKAGIIGSF